MAGVVKALSFLLVAGEEQTAVKDVVLRHWGCQMVCVQG